MPMKRSEWVVPALLVLLSIVPAIGGVVRMSDLGAGHAITPENARFHAAPFPITLHIATALPFALVGALQFAPALRRRGRAWHRLAGRVLAPLGIFAALTGLWMTLVYPWPPTDGRLVYLERLIFGIGMLVSLVLALVAVRRRAFMAHGDWMTRAYAIGLGAGTQVLTHIPWFLTMDMHPGGYPRAVMMGAGWAINVLVAEQVIRGRATNGRPRNGVSPQPYPTLNAEMRA
jgi:uncharacterized membrane protein